jgi:pyruvate formate lyase activating enzyme
MGNPVVFDVYRGTSHDGPGLRTTFFFKGCSLRCAWCQNPEGIALEPEIWWDERRCIGCQLCVNTCANRALVFNGTHIQLDRKLCRNCSLCVKQCPTRALSYTGERWTQEDLLRQALKDKPFYIKFGGGVTASGGEPLMQAPHIKVFFKNLHDSGIHTALDTCGNVPWERLEMVLPETDCVLYDIKLFNSQIHKQYTGAGNELLMDNLFKLADYIRKDKYNKQLWIRTPLIPGITATEENIYTISNFLTSELLDLVERWELCAFNNTCKKKYQKMGLTWALESESLLQQSVVNLLKQNALRTGFPNERLVLSGIVAQ